jgi:2-oxoglutarate ferredoxin oxidoreductase subunit gamma
MKEHVLVASGFGGQGIMLLGQILATAAMVDNKFSTWLPSYGPEMRGGTANCTVVISDEHIGSPVTDTPREAIVMNIPSLLKFEERILPGGLLVINSSVVDREPERKDIEIVKVDANKVAERLGNTRAANMVILGAYLAKTGAVSEQSVEQALKMKFGNKKDSIVDLNMKALRAGAEAVKN